MKRRHAKTLAALRRADGSVEIRQIEALIRELGGDIEVRGNGLYKAVLNDGGPGQEAETLPHASGSDAAMMTYRGYPAAIEYDDGSRFFYGHVLGTKDTIGFEGRSVDELEASFHRAVDEYLRACEEAGREPDRAYSGTIFIRTDPDTHRRVEASAAASGQSINQWAQAALLARLGE